MHRPMVLGVTIAAIVAVTLLGWTAVGQEREFRRLLVTGDSAVLDGRVVDAVEAFSGALALRPDGMVAYLKRGDAHRRRGDLATALRDLHEAHAIDPTAPEPLESLGDVASALGRHSDSVQHYRDYLAIDERSASVNYKLGLSLYRGAQLEASLEPLRRAIGTDPPMGEAHYVLGLVLRDLGRLPEARAHLTTATQLRPTLAPARLALAEIDGISRTRQDILQSVLKMTPSTTDEAGVLVRAALAYAELGETDRAARELIRASAGMPDNPTISLALGYVWVTAAESAGDRAALIKALARLGPLAARPGASGDVLALYGRALLLNGQRAHAERTLVLAVERPPVDARAYRDLAEAALSLGHTATARDASARHDALAPAAP